VIIWTGTHGNQSIEEENQLYVPILKNRSVEVSVLEDLLKIPLSEHTTPLVEIIQERVRSNSPSPFVEQLAKLLSQNPDRSQLFVDVPRLSAPSGIPSPVREFLIRANRDHSFWLSMLLSLAGLPGVVPVVSYNPLLVPGTELLDHISLLRRQFETLAFRLTAGTFPDVFPLIARDCIKEQDFVMLDIGSAGHTNPVLKSMYEAVRQQKGHIGYTSVIVHSPRRRELTNKSLEDGKPIVEIDNSLRDFFRVHHFDGFGDYAGITSDLPTTGGSISPAGVYYSFADNVFVGFRRHLRLSEFEEYIAPAIVASPYWQQYSPEHHERCPGCREILKISAGKQKGSSQAKWKGITMAHYIYAIDESMASGRV